MASAPVLLLSLLLVSLVSAFQYFERYTGGTVKFTYKGRNSDGSYKVIIRNRNTFGNCFDHLYWSCKGLHCSENTISQTGVLDSSTKGPQVNSQWCETETVITKKLWSDKPFQERAAGCCWTPTRNEVGSWRLMTHVDLGTRTDTRQPNRSPNIAILPFLRVPQDCSRTYNLMSYDPDGDQVRCRYGMVPGEECYNCSLPSGFHLDEDNCTLHYLNTSASHRVFVFELVVEDFPQGNITLAYTDGSHSSRSPLMTLISWPWFPATAAPLYANTAAPLSKLPLQFSLLVDQPAPSCQEGIYLPEFLHPTPENGAHIHARVNREVEIRVKAQAVHATSYDIISGTLNITKDRNTHDEFVIKWTPFLDDLGDHYPICFAVEAVTWSGIYQSEMRCVVVDVEKEQVKSHVVCDESSMTFHVEKSSFDGLHEDRLQLIDPSNIACSLQTHSNSTHVIAVIPLNACGTQIEEDNDYLMFKNEITTVDNITHVITRNHLLKVQFYCKYPKRGNVTLGFTAHRKNVTVWEKGLGNFTYNFEFYLDGRYQTSLDPRSYPLEYDLGSRIYMQIEVTSSVHNTELFVESCRATPYDYPNYHPTYSIIENGCIVDRTVRWNRTRDNQFRFSMEAFKYIGLHDQVYISCSVVVCEAGSQNTRCSQGCIDYYQHRYRKREAIVQTGNHFVSQGPLRLKRSVTNLNLNLVFIAGCLLAVVGMVCGVVMYKVVQKYFRPGAGCPIAWGK